jgi:sigma-B regulation protein RsbU (phosphoserine phosphatase)
VKRNGFSRCTFHVLRFTPARRSFLKALSRWKSTTRFGKFSIFVISGYVLIELLSALFNFSTGILDGLFRLALFVVIVRYAFKWTRRTMQKLLWRLRRRLLITYMLIGVVPVILLLTIMAISGILFFGYLTSFFVNDGIEHLNAELETTAQALVGPMLDALSNTQQLTTAEWQKQWAPWLARLESQLGRVWMDAQSGSRTLALEFRGGRLLQRSEGMVKPAWLTKNTSGIFEEGSNLLIAAFAAREEAGTPGWLLLRAPLDATAFKSVSQHAVASIRLGTLSTTGTSEPTLGPPVEPLYTIRQAWYDFPIMFVHPLRPRLWATGAPLGQETRIYSLIVESTGLHIIRRIFSVRIGGEQKVVAIALLATCGFFLLIELVALICAVVMTRTITGTVYRLDEGAKHILRGDFSHRIPVKVRDQLSALGETFNTMAASIERLLKEEAEKQRLDSELAIAREVQQHLFPREAPHLTRLQLAGRCQPARIVSGDYYDFLVFAPTTLGIALGDVSGKGVSAALLMASLQAALRSHAGVVGGQFARGAAQSLGRSQGSRVAIAVPVAEVVSLLNQQLYQNTPIEQYATLFYAVYEEPSAELIYTNAGHLPPLVFTANGVRRLETGGTVVGLFPDSEYEQGVIRFAMGDVLVAYTDGITEATSPWGEQFGEARLIASVERLCGEPADVIVTEVLRTVNEWMESDEPQDDMTLIVAKAT